MPRRTLTIRGVSDATLRTLRGRAAANRRSLNSQLLLLLEQAALQSEAGGESGDQVRERPVAPYSSVTRRRGPSRRPAPGPSEALSEVCRRHGIRTLFLFGSSARGEARDDSDVDVLVEFEPGRTPGLGIVMVAEALGPVLGGKRVDLVTLRGLRPAMRERVLAEAVLLHGA